MKTIMVEFLDNSRTYGKIKQYCYFVDDDENPIVDQVAVVKVSDEFKLVKITEVRAGHDPKATKPIVAFVDMSRYEARLKKAEQRANLVAKLNELDKQQSEIVRFRHLAEAVPEAKDLLAQLEAL